MKDIKKVLKKIGSISIIFIVWVLLSEVIGFELTVLWALASIYIMME